VFCLILSALGFTCSSPALAAEVFLTHLSLLIAGSKSSFFFKSTWSETSDKTSLSSSDNFSDLL